MLKDSAKADERDLLDHGLNLVIDSDPLNPAITALREGTLEMLRPLSAKEGYENCRFFRKTMG